MVKKVAKQRFEMRAGCFNYRKVEMQRDREIEIERGRERKRETDVIHRLGDLLITPRVSNTEHFCKKI